MPASKIGVIYDSATGQVLRVVVPDDDWKLALHVGEGEALLQYDRGKYEKITHENFQAELAKMVEAASGKVFVAEKSSARPAALSEETATLQKKYIEAHKNP